MALAPLSLDDLSPRAEFVVENYAVVARVGDSLYHMGYSVPTAARAQKWLEDFKAGKKAKYSHYFQKWQEGEYEVYAIKVVDVQERQVTRL